MSFLNADAVNLNIGGNSAFPLDALVAEMLVIKNIINPVGINLLKEKLEYAQRVYQRECEGENLVVNHIAIPHCWSESSEKFRGYFIHLAQPVMVNNQTVWHLLMACTGTASRQELKIFSYLANALNGCEPQTISGLKSYEEFMALLA
jgi:putative frv operon regulatory protein